MLTVSSAAFAGDGTIPVRHSGLGEDASPPLAWSRPPGRTKALVVLCEDPDAKAGTWLHWLIYDIPASENGLPQGIPRTEAAAGGARQGRNSFGRLGWNGPCPPAGEEHRYVFRLFAVSKLLGLQPGAGREEALEAMKGWILARAELTGRFRRPDGK